MIAVPTFVTAGNSVFTLKSNKTGKHFTFKARRPSPDKPVFVSVLSGPDNTSDYSYLGFIGTDGRFRTSKGSKIGTEADSYKAFNWFWDRANNLPKVLEFIPSGKCCRCGRELTTPDSVAKGIGPECEKHV